MMTLCRFLIVEDELLIAEAVSQMLNKEGYEHVHIVTSAEEAMSYIASNPVNFVLTDIALGKGKTGIDLGELLSGTYKIPFIYITSHADRGMLDKAKQTRPQAYIVKPFKKEDLLVAIELGMYNAASAPERPTEGEELIVREGRTTVRLYHSNILWFESEGNYTTIHLRADRRRVIRQSLSELQEQLPSAGFIRIHKSYLVNKAYVTEVRANSLMLGPQELSVGRAYQQNLLGVFR